MVSQSHKDDGFATRPLPKPGLPQSDVEVAGFAAGMPAQRVLLTKSYGVGRLGGPCPTDYKMVCQCYRPASSTASYSIAATDSGGGLRESRGTTDIVFCCQDSVNDTIHFGKALDFR